MKQNIEYMPDNNFQAEPVFSVRSLYFLYVACLLLAPPVPLSLASVESQMSIDS